MAEGEQGPKTLRSLQMANEKPYKLDKNNVQWKMIHALSNLESELTALFLDARSDVDAGSAVSDILEKVQKLKHYAIVGL